MEPGTLQKCSPSSARGARQRSRARGVHLGATPGAPSMVTHVLRTNHHGQGAPWILSQTPTNTHLQDTRFGHLRTAQQIPVTRRVFACAVFRSISTRRHSVLDAHVRYDDDDAMVSTNRQRTPTRASLHITSSRFHSPGVRLRPVIARTTARAALRSRLDKITQ
jgi:hypothetical protein